MIAVLEPELQATLPTPAGLMYLFMCFVTIRCLHFSICACHPCGGAMLVFSASFNF